MESLFYRENDGKGADAIVFIHGGGISGRMWQEALNGIADYHCLAPDLPGHGESRQITPFSLTNAVEGLVALIQDHVPAQRAAIVAISVGAPVTIELIRRYPDILAHTRTGTVSTDSTRLDGEYRP